MIPTYRPYIGDAELQAVKKVFESRWLGMGSIMEQFENTVRKFLGVKHLIAVNSGTAALHLALNSLGLRPNVEVIVPSLTFSATIQAIILSGAVPVFCEVLEDTLNMDANDIIPRISDQTQVILPVHYGGVACQMDEILGVARQYELIVIEDAAHAFGSEYKGHMIGTLGDATCFSFDPIKNITCAGGGALATNNNDIAEYAKLARYLGINRSSWKRASSENNWFYEVVGDGFRYHMSDLHAAIGLEQFKRFSQFKKRKQTIVRRYDEAFGEVCGLKLVRRNLKDTFPFGYFLRIVNGRREAFIRYLRDKGIETRVQFVPNHLQPAFAKYKVSLPRTEHLYKEIVTLPLFYELRDEDVDKVIASVLTFLKKSDCF